MENKFSLLDYLDINKAKIDILYNPLNIELIPININLSEKELPNYDKNKNIFITTGRLIKEKGHAKIIESFSAIRERYGENFLYYIIGSGPEFQMLDKLIMRH